MSQKTKQHWDDQLFKLKLSEAINDGRYWLIESMLDGNPDFDINTPIGNDGQSLLSHMVKFPSGEALQSILKRGGNSTVLQQEAVGMLLSRGADPDQPDNYGRTPLHSAVIEGNIELTENLLRAGADMNKQDMNGRTAVYHAVDKNRPEILDFLLEAGADASLTHEDGVSPLDLARQKEIQPMDAELSACKPVPALPRDKDAVQWSDLIQKNDTGLCALDANQTWYLQDDWLQDVLPLNKEDLLKEGKNGKAYLTRAIECGVGKVVIGQFLAQGDVLTPNDLLDDGKANGLLNAITEAGLVPDLLKKEMWLPQGHHALKKVYAALPEKVRAEDNNIHGLFLEVSRHERKQQVQR